MRIGLLLWKNEMVICGSCGEEIRAKDPRGTECVQVFVGDLEEQSFSVLCSPCMDLEEAAIADGIEFTDINNPENDDQVIP